MLKPILGVLALIFVCQLVMPADADARRRGGWRSGGGKSVPIIVPIPRGSKDVVLVKKLPRQKSFKHEGKHFDLGYKHGWFGTGEWVGMFRGPPKAYIELNQKVVKEKLLPMLGISANYVPGKGKLKLNRKSSQSPGRKTAGRTEDKNADVHNAMTGMGKIVMAWPLLLIGLVIFGIASRVRASMQATVVERQSRSFMDAPIAIDDPGITPEKNARFDDSIQHALRERQAANNLPPEPQEAVSTPSRYKSGYTPTRSTPKNFVGSPPAFGRR